MVFKIEDKLSFNFVVKILSEWICSPLVLGFSHSTAQLYLKITQKAKKDAFLLKNVIQTNKSYFNWLWWIAATHGNKWNFLPFLTYFSRKFTFASLNRTYSLKKLNSLLLSKITVFLLGCFAEITFLLIPQFYLFDLSTPMNGFVLCNHSLYLFLSTNMTQICYIFNRNI